MKDLKRRQDEEERRRSEEERARMAPPPPTIDRLELRPCRYANFATFGRRDRLAECSWGLGGPFLW